MNIVLRIALIGITVSMLGVQFSGQSQQGNLAQAIEMNVAEVSTGKLAAEKSTTVHVKAYAEMMVRDHTDAIRKLRAIPGAPAGDIKPSAMHQETIDRLSKMFGEQLDHEYINAMVRDHKDELSFFENQNRQALPVVLGDGARDSAANGPTLAKVAEELILVVREHLKEAQQIQGELSGFLQPNTVRQGANVFSETGTAPAAGGK